MTKKEEDKKETLLDFDAKEPPIEYPVDSIPIRRYNVVLDEANLEEDGSWTVKRTTKQVISFDKKIWFVREIAFKAIDKDFASANETTFKVISNLLEEYNGDFFSKGKWDHAQYVMKADLSDQVVGERYHGIVEDVKNTKA